MYDPLLKVFIIVVESGSFAKAGDRLFTSSTAIMKQMNQLEKRLGLTLLSRTPRGVQLTKSGESIYKDAKDFIKLAEKSIERALKAQSESQQQISMGSSLLYSGQLLLNTWHQISDRYPGFSLRIVPFEETVNPQQEVGKRFDFYMGVYNSSIAKNYCQFTQLGSEKFCIAMSKNHPLARHDKLQLSDLKSEKLMMTRRGVSPINDQLRDDIENNNLGTRIIDVPHHYNINLFNGCMEQHYVLLSLEGWNDIHPSITSIPLDVPYAIPYGIITSKTPSKATKQFIHLMLSI